MAATNLASNDNDDN